MTHRQMIDEHRHVVVNRTIDANGHLNRAAICLYRADHLHIGPIRGEYLAGAAEHLRLAGQTDLANRVAGGGNLRPVEDAVRELLESMPNVRKGFVTPQGKQP